MDDILVDFLTETSESLTEIDSQLVEFEKNPTNREILGNIFRLVHTIKGTCGFLGLDRLAAVAHVSENLLSVFREEEAPATAEGVTLVLNGIDRIRDLLSALEDTGQEPDGNDQDLITALSSHVESLQSGASEGIEVETSPDGNDVRLEEGDSVLALGSDVAVSEAADSNSSGGIPVADSSLPDTESIADVEQLEEPDVISPDSESTGSQTQVSESSQPKDDTKAGATNLPATAGKESSIANSTIRVGVDVLENIMVLVSELLLTRNQLLQLVRGLDDSEFSAPLQRLSHITSDLQDGVMKTRMQPIGNAWAKLPRIVRDLATDSGKMIDLEMRGADTELDRQVLELIRDPLTHMVRNAADHGLEMPADRVAAGKPEKGQVLLNAYHEGGHIIMEISDDGRGLNFDNITKKIVSKGLASEAEVDSMSRDQICQFIFNPGFSTAEKVTSVSGRGVGMDVVRTNIEKIGGTVDLKSEPGNGTKFTIKIPLTLAIISALLVEAGHQRFAIPQISVLELVRITPTSSARIEVLKGAEVLRLRDQLLPLVAISDLLDINGQKSKPLNTIDERQETFVVVSQAGSSRFGIIVDQVFDAEEIVVKPVSSVLLDIPYFAGNTILGDGTIIMILDPNAISSQIGGVVADDSSASISTRSDEGASRSMTLLVFKAGGQEVKAVPLSLVSRIEYIDIEKIEHSQGAPVIQYRNSVMPLFAFDDRVTWRQEGRQPILVFSDKEEYAGLAVDEIIDIKEASLDLDDTDHIQGCSGTAIIDGMVMDITDVSHILESHRPAWFDAEKYSTDLQPTETGQSVLLVEDSAFFRNMVTPLLTSEGFNVCATASPKEALELLESGREFDAIISDIEMPGMSGLEFAREVRSRPQWSGLPLIAFSSRFSESDVEAGATAGFNDYVAKVDRESLVPVLRSNIFSVQEAA